MKGKIISYCKKCKNKSFRIEKRVEGKSSDSIIMHETLGHDGWGYDLNTFDIICNKCGEINQDKFELKKNAIHKKLQKM